MNLTKLFNMQRELDEHIEQEHPRMKGEDRLAKKVLALQVELGELANEWRGFKFWSTDQEPRYERECHVCEGKGRFTSDRFYRFFGHKIYHTEPCLYCNETGVEERPLLEEYVDCLHFILSIGLDLNINIEKVQEYINPYTSRIKNIEDRFLLVNHLALNMYQDIRDNDGKFAVVHWKSLLERFIRLGDLLGLSWEQIEQAYIDKNTVNHERQLNGY